MAGSGSCRRRCCSGVAALGFGAVGLLAACTVAFHSLFDVWEQRISRLEETLRTLGIATANSEQKVLALEQATVLQQSLLQTLQSAPAVEIASNTLRQQQQPLQQQPIDSQCANFGEFVSLDAIGAQGWFASVENAELDPGFLGWSGGANVGAVYGFLRHAGTLTMKVTNAHAVKDPQNWVKVWVNNDLVATVGPNSHEKLCLEVRPGDVVAIKERYGKIWLRNVKLRCSLPLAPAAATILGTSRTQCSEGQKVRWKPRLCNAQKWSEGTIEKVLNGTRAAVKVQKGKVERPERGKVANAKALEFLSASDLQLVGDGSAPGQLCTSFAGVKREKVGIVVISNKQFLESYSLHIKSQRCFAARNGYDYWILKPGSYEACDEFVDNIFFEKHCIVSEFLKERPLGYVAVVMDADCMAVVLERGVEQWLGNTADIMFYERDFQDEIAAGNYIARNTPAARNFLMKWAHFYSRQPPGFSSADNGAIHLHLVESLGIEGAAECAKMYSQLTATVENMNPYFKYVKCTLKLLGSPRTWTLSGGGSLAIWPRLSFFVVDGFVVNRKYSDTDGPVFHHGIKQKEEAAKHYVTFDHCALNSATYGVSAEELGRIAAGFATGRKDLFRLGTACLQTMSCVPLGGHEGTRPNRRCKDCK